MKPTVYVETTIPSYLTAWPSKDVVRAAHQQITREWWAQRALYDLYISRLVVNECESGDPVAAQERLAAIVDIPLVEQTTEVARIANLLIIEIPLPEKASADAIHIASAAVHGIDYLLTWNCSHIANVMFRTKIELVCRREGYNPPLICTPEELKIEESYDG
jgi:predicted nucleic acid-binding protein